MSEWNFTEERQASDRAQFDQDLAGLVEDADFRGWALWIHGWVDTVLQSIIPSELIEEKYRADYDRLVVDTVVQGARGVAMFADQVEKGLRP